MGIFYDSESNEAELRDITIVENSAVHKRLSGVYYYSTGSTFTTEIDGCNYLNADSYPLIQVEVYGTEYGLPDLDLEGGDISHWDSNHDRVNATYQNWSWAISQSNFCNISDTANVSARPMDWEDGEFVYSTNASVAIDTYADNSTRISHDFRTEDDRFTSTWGDWDSTEDLTTYDDTLGLQCRCSRLVYPTESFETYAPQSSRQPDYSEASGTRTYFFEMYHTGTAHSNGRFILGDYDITEADITADDFMIEISLDDTNWYNLNENYAGGALSDGDGCRTNVGTISLALNNSIEFTLGTGGFTASGTGPSGWGIYVRISWKAAISSKYLGSITESTWV